MDAGLPPFRFADLRRGGGDDRAELLAGLKAARASIQMTMTSPACPLGPFIMDQARSAIEVQVPELAEVEIELVWEPPWHPGLMAEHVAGAFGAGR